MSDSNYQKAYYLSHLSKLRAKHRAYSRAYNKKLYAGQIIPLPRSLYKQDDICPICQDYIFGPQSQILIKNYKYQLRDRIFAIDSGCAYLLRVRRAREVEV